MIEYRGRFKKKELAFISILNECFEKLFLAKGTVKKKGEHVRYEIYIGDTEKKELLILQFCVRIVKILHPDSAISSIFQAF